VPYSISCNVAGSFDPGAAQPRRHHASKGRQLTSGRRLDAHRSRFVARARDLEPGLLSALRLDEVALSSADVLVRVCSLLTDGTDGRPWQERLEDAFQGGPKPEVVVARLEDLANGDLQSAIETTGRGPLGGPVTRRTPDGCLALPTTTSSRGLCGRMRLWLRSLCAEVSAAPCRL